MSAMPVQIMGRTEWASVAKERVAPTCDARPGHRSADVDAIAVVRSMIDTWAEAHARRPRRPVSTNDGAVAGELVDAKPDGSRAVEALAFECDVGGTNAILVDGAPYAFDIAWTVVPNGSSFATIEAFSFKDKLAYLASVGLSAAGGTSETFIVTHVGAYVPDDLDVPVVRNLSTSGEPLLETFVFRRGGSEGFYFLAPRSDDTAARFMEVGRFKIDDG